MLRSLFIALSGNKVVRGWAEQARMGRRLASRFVAGMTVEEAVLEMDKTRDYLVYRDAQTDRVSVILRRRDGHFDLVEG